jgi:hypothetical protein
MKKRSPEAIEMALEVREILGAHMLKFPKDKYAALIDCLIVLCHETGLLRWLSISTGEVSQEEFDRIFKEGMLKKYEEAKSEFGGYKN